MWEDILDVCPVSLSALSWSCSLNVFSVVGSFISWGRFSRDILVTGLPFFLPLGNGFCPVEFLGCPVVRNVVRSSKHDGLLGGQHRAVCLVAAL